MEWPFFYRITGILADKIRARNQSRRKTGLVQINVIPGGILNLVISDTRDVIAAINLFQLVKV